MGFRYGICVRVCVRDVQENKSRIWGFGRALRVVKVVFLIGLKF